MRCPGDCRLPPSALTHPLKRPFKIALDQGFIGRNPVAGVRLLRSSKVEKHVFRPEQVARLCAAAAGDWKGLILVGYYTGQRLGDLARLRWSSVDLREKTISFMHGKTGAKVRIPIHPEPEAHLLASPTPGKRDAPVFPALHDKPGTGRSGLSVAFKRVVEKAGIDAGQLRARRGQKGRSLSALSFHSLRHSFTRALANEGVPPELRQKFTGHASAETNPIYTHHELETLRQAVMKLPSLPTTEN